MSVVSCAESRCHEQPSKGTLMAEQTMIDAPAARVSVTEQSMWELSIDMLAVASPEGYLTRLSPSWETTLGYTLEELMSRPYLDLVHPDDLERTRTGASVLGGPEHETVCFEVRYRAKGGEYRRLAWTSRASEDGTSIYFVVRDLTEQRDASVVRDRALARLRDRDLTLTRVMENTMTLISIKDLNGRYLLYNQPFADALNLDGRGATEGKPGLEVLLGRDDTWLDPELGPTWRANDVLAAEGSRSIEECSDHPERGRLTYDSIKFPLHDGRGKVYATCGVSLETTERVRAIQDLKEAEEGFRTAFDAAPIGKALVGLDRKITRVNEKLCAIPGHSAAELIGTRFMDMSDSTEGSAMGPPMEELLAGEIQTFEHERQLFNAKWPPDLGADDRGGRTRWGRRAAVRDRAGPGHLGAQRLENKLRVTADHDALTGIRNRRLFEEDLFTQVGRCQRYGEHAALLLLDLDDFKQINDRYGHKTGDDTLKLVARTIKKRLRLPRIRSHGLVAMSSPPCFPTLVAGRPSSGNRAR